VRRSVALVACALAGCSGSDVETTGWPFDPVKFFTGHTQGDATLRLISGASHRVSVDSRGRPDGHGGLVLDQRIREAGKPERTRQWVLHPAGPNRWTGTLTDAVGPVAVERTSEDVTIRYRMHGGAEVEQHLGLPPGGATADNHLTVSRFGIRLATLDEKIRKVP
jgi:hypothetical protein